MKGRTLYEKIQKQTLCAHANPTRICEPNNWLHGLRNISRSRELHFQHCKRRRKSTAFCRRQRSVLWRGSWGSLCRKFTELPRFIPVFSLTPKGRNHINVCLGTACYVKGGNRIYELLQSKLGIQGGQCTPDGRFSLDACRCLGCCGMAPVIMINEDVYGSLTGEELDAILAKYP